MNVKMSEGSENLRLTIPQSDGTYLFPCPFCGNNNLREATVQCDHIICNNCLASGPIEKSVDSSVQLMWNHRYTEEGVVDIDALKENEEEIYSNIQEILREEELKIYSSIYDIIQKEFDNEKEYGREPDLNYLAHCRMKYLGMLHAIEIMGDNIHKLKKDTAYLE